jgi:FkbM family methyltransferase
MKLNQFVLRDGTLINIHPDSQGLNFIFYTIYIKEDYDGKEKYSIKKSDTIIDIGAHIGFFTIKAAKKATEGKVYAFEPFSKHFQLLEENVKQNNLSNVKIFNEAVSDKQGTTTFYYTMNGDPGDTSLYVVNPEKEHYQEEIKTFSLDELFEREQINKCDFLKLDCEGSEYKILYNASDKTLNSIEKIVMEWHKFSDDHNVNELADFLKEKGFNVNITNNSVRTGYIYAHR